MRMSTVAHVLSAAAMTGVVAQNVTTGQLGDAAARDDNPKGAQYIATLPDAAFDKDAFPDGGNVKGSLQAVSSPDGEGVMFQVKLSGLPDEGGPFIYHIHDQPVPDDGNCTGTLAHLDPYERGEASPCDKDNPQTCQVGDLSGKHGKIENVTDFTATYTDLYASTLDGIGAFFGNRSFVLHFANKTRITCANFTAVDTGAGSCSSSSTTTTTTTGESYSSATATSATTAADNSSATATSTSSPAGGNDTATTATPTTAIVTAGGNANYPVVNLVGAAIIACLLL